MRIQTAVGIIALFAIVAGLVVAIEYDDQQKYVGPVAPPHPPENSENNGGSALQCTGKVLESYPMGQTLAEDENGNRIRLSAHVESVDWISNDTAIVVAYISNTCMGCGGRPNCKLEGNTVYLGWWEDCDESEGNGLKKHAMTACYEILKVRYTISGVRKGATFKAG